MVRNGHVDVLPPNRAATVRDLSPGSRASFDPRPLDEDLLSCACSDLNQLDRLTCPLPSCDVSPLTPS